MKPIENANDKQMKEKLNPVDNSNWYNGLNDTNEFAKLYREEAIKVEPEKAKNIIGALEDYSKEAQRGFITREQIDKYNKRLGLDKMSDRELRQAWEDIHNVAGYYGYGQKDFNKSSKMLDGQSAFAEVVNEEARKRKATGNYFPYDENDIAEAKEEIRKIAKPHEGYDLDSHEAYLTTSEADKIKNIANAYRLTDEDLAKISSIFSGYMGYTGFGYKAPKK